MRKIIITFIILISGAFAGQAKDPAKVIWNDCKAAYGDFGELFGSYSKLRFNDFYLPLGATAATLLATTQDDAVRDFARRNQTRTWQNITDISNNGGELLAAAILPGALYAAGLAIDSKELRDVGRISYESILLSGVITTSIKMIVGRARPYNNLGTRHFKMFNVKVDKFMSFPSGHTTVAFALATVFADRAGSVWAYPVFYTLALSTAYARIYKDKHWLSDVVGGAAIGTLSSLALLHANDSREKKDADNAAGTGDSFYQQSNSSAPANIVLPVVPNNYFYSASIPIFSYTYSW